MEFNKDDIISYMWQVLASNPKRKKKKLCSYAYFSVCAYIRNFSYKLSSKTDLLRSKLNNKPRPNCFMYYIV